MGNEIKGMLVGCDDLEEGGYEWVINQNDWDNGSKEITDKLNEHKNKKDFNIYFYVFTGQKEFHAKTSDEFRGTIFGRAEIKNIELYKNDPNQGFYPHHVKLKNFELFDPKIKLEDIEVTLEKYGWTDKQKANNPFPNNLRQHGLLLTKNDCDLINEYVNNNFNSDNLDDMEDVIMEKREIETDDDEVNSNEYEALIIGLYCRPNRQGYHYVLDFCEDDGHRGGILTKVGNFKTKKAYFYIFENYENKPDDMKLNDWEKFKTLYGDKLGRIFGEGLIKDVDVKNNRIIYQYVTHYHDYVEINRVTKLFKRYEEINRNEPDKKRFVKRLIAFGLPLTKDECDQISSLAGFD